ncbi:MAG: urate hydroxylase PuuD [Burkholderiales bacterium]|nr:urate hydroxylase PuuD [Burkholderiales bacterium]
MDINASALVPPYLLSYALDWFNLLLRWLHMITGIAWIGASFYFVWLDNSIRPPEKDSDLAKKGVSGHLWAVHGGGFYNPQKYLVAPSELPPELHWFKWEAYSTWLSGFALLTVVYYFNAQAMIIDKSVADISSVAAIGIGLGSLLAGWTVYDLLCRSKLGQNELAFGVVVYLLLVGAAFGLSQVFSGRAAYIHVGAIIGTIMVGNVLMLIIPGQRKLVEAMRAGQKPDPIHGIRGKQRSVHNNYFTLPILFIMISNHFGMTYNHRYSWLVLAAIMAAGVLIRHFFNLRHKGRTAWGYPLAGCAILLALAIYLAPNAPVANSSKAPDLSRVQQIMQARCVACHAEHPTQAGFTAAPAGVKLDSAANIQQHAARVYKQAVELRAMPLANMTQMTDAERQEIAAWFMAGAK